MTTNLHLDTDVTDLTALKIRLTAEEFYDQADRLYALLANTAWDGTSKDEFLYQLYCHTSKIKSLSNELHLMGFQLVRETDEWISISANFTC